MQERRGHSVDVNPYAPPSSDGAALLGAHQGDARALEAIRKQCIKREANIKSIGTLSFLAATLYLVVSVQMLAVDVVAFAGVLALAVLCIVLGRWLRALKPAGRVGVTIIVSLGLAFNIFSHFMNIESGATNGAYLGGFALGSALVPSIILFVLWSAPSATIFGEHYRTVVVPATPHVKYKSKAVWVLLVILVALVGVGALLAALN